MSTPISIGDSLKVYGIHAFGGLAAAASVCVLAKKIQDCFFPNTNRNLSKYIAPGVGFLAGIATSMWIASSPTAQKVATNAVLSVFSPKVTILIGQAPLQLFLDIGPKATMLIGEAPLQLFLAIIGPQFSSLSSVFCGVAGALLGSWAFHKLS